MAVVYAKFTTRTGQGQGITRGDAWDPEDPMVVKHPDWFTEDPEEFTHRSRPVVVHQGQRAPVVEQATAAPGEQRNVKLPAKTPRSA